ncbi:LysR family transcriptional regulator [Paludibacterium purpuratum]|uniref:LysR family transcriptional regulator n=1 Tax=Paludibacterium purpuratum TaxID=1144873 RepID=A0A4R7B6D0_9NEIS|nr:LysR family transcriptional regulator [Paludibacterium purpuratum]TDR80211.1 LysR family transcriptional regulator [Paludibacterium purpuratum]
MLDDLALFVCIVENGSLNAAAAKLDMPAATLTRRLQKLEQALGCRLLHRSARRLIPTGEGWQYFERCRPLLASLQQATASLDAELNRPAGTVRVLAPITLAGIMYRDAWASFLARYPEIQLELRLANEREDLLTQGADLALRVGELDDPLFGQRLLGWGHTTLVASPDYLARHPVLRAPNDLSGHTLLMAEPLTSWRLQHESSGERMTIQPDGPVRLRVNDMQLAIEMAVAGQGILYCPLRAAEAALADDRLRNPLPGWRGISLPVYALWPPQRTLPARVRVLLDHLLAYSAGSERLI